MLVKYIHVTCVVITFVLFFIRGLWMIFDSPLARQKWTRRLPPVIDTVLLVSATILAITLHQYPFVHSWLTAKVIGLLFYIGLGMLAITYGHSKKIRITAWVLAQLCFVYIVLVALNKSPSAGLWL
ncbi:MAG: SirB2 family protein [Gammaproteobacteria bacterium]|nr:SirB2 family protein [Gammaproteobacteria bacterium]